MIKEFLFCSLILWQIGFIVFFILKKFYQPNKPRPQSIRATEWRPPVVEVDLPKPKHVDIEMKKQIHTEKPTLSSIKSDEVIKGKVKTQKRKLRKLTRGL